MNKNKLFTISAILLLISLFITAATCNLCGINFDTANSEATKIDVETDTETEAKPTQDTETTPSGNADEDKDKEAPAISLEVIEGPQYSEADGVCWYRVKATVTGSPSPKIKWSADYSNNAFGDYIAQVNLTRDNPDYTLTATATNSEGTATDEIDLSWGCNGAGEEEDETLTAIAMQTERLNIIGSRSGSISYNLDIGEATDTSGIIYTGDDEVKNIYKAFLCFDISGLRGINIANAQLEIANIRKFGEPLDWASFIYFHSVDYGDVLETSEMYSLATTQVFAARVNELGMSITQTSDGLVQTIRDAIEDGRNWYQLSAGLGGAAVTDNDTEKDGYRFALEGLVLQINYFE